MLPPFANVLKFSSGSAHAANFHGGSKLSKNNSKNNDNETCIGTGIGLPIGGLIDRPPLTAKEAWVRGTEALMGQISTMSEHR